MSTKTAFEALPADRLQAAVTRGLAKRLGARLTLTPIQGPARRTQAAARDAADLVISVDGEPFIVQLKGGAVSGRELLAAMYESMAAVFEHYHLLVLPDSDPELAPIISAVVEQVPGAVRARRQALTEQHIDALVDVYLANDPLAAAMPDLERDNAEAQARFLKRWRVLTADDVAARAGHGSKNRSATASRWKRAGKIFAVRSGGREVYPAFQFKDGQPHPVIGPVLAALPETMSGWQTAFWFVGPNSWLDGEAPATRLDDEAALVAAARHEDESWMG